MVQIQLNSETDNLCFIFHLSEKLQTKVSKKEKIFLTVLFVKFVIFIIGKKF